MKNIVKKFDRVGLMVLLVAFFVAVGFKAAEKMENASAWYEVEITPGEDPNLPHNQEIKSTPFADPLGDCATGSTICFVELTLTAGAPLPSNMQEALDRQASSTPDVKIEDQRYKN